MKNEKEIVLVNVHELERDKAKRKCVVDNRNWTKKRNTFFQWAKENGAVGNPFAWSQSPPAQTC